MSARIPAITIDELLAFNDELRAIARTGIPLERGLRALGADLPNRLGRLALLISERMERGESLESVLEDPDLSLPPVYSAVVAAGVRGGRLPAALESLSRSVQRSAEVRQAFIIALVYPLLLLLIASGIFTFTWSVLFPTLQRSISALLERDLPKWFQWLGWTTEQGSSWLPFIWIAIVGLGFVWFVRSNRAAAFATGWRRWPSVRSANTAGRVATFAETLALLIEVHVPMTEALALAGAACGDQRIHNASKDLAERIRSGERAGTAPRGMPALLSWLILTNASSTQLVRTLRQTAASQREYANRVSLFIVVYFPIFFSGIVGGAIAIYYAILVMMPFVYLLYELGQP